MPNTGFSHWRFSRWSCECKFYCTSTNIYCTSSQIHIYMLSSFTLLPWCNLFQSSNKRSWIKYSKLYQSTIWLVKQPGILTHTRFVVWPEENWPPTELGFSFFVLSLMEFGFLPLSPLACLVGDTNPIGTLILNTDRPALTPLYENWTELGWHHCFLQSCLIMKMDSFYIWYTLYSYWTELNQHS